MTNIPEYLHILVGRRSTGTLHSLGEGSSFNYEPDWQSLPWVSLTMPPRARSWLWARGLHPVFEMRMPEGYLLETLKNAFLKRYGRTDDLFLLGMLASSLKGRIEYSCPWSSGQEEKPADMRLSDVLDSCDPEFFSRLLDRFLTRSFVSGVQPKVLARLSGESFFTSRDYIIKTWGDEYPYLADNEFLCMTAARRAGIQVPFFALSTDSRFFVVERFDIDRYGHTQGFEELCALQGKNSSGKFSGSYEEAARTVGVFVTDDASIATFEAFFSILALSMLVRNGNAHLKNFGILYDFHNASRGLAPCYDVVTTAAYTHGDLPALSFSGRKLWPDRKRLVEFGVHACNLDRKRAGELWDSCAQAVADTRQDVLAHARERPGFGVIAERMLAAWETGLMDRR